jgi:hypothetical protein
MNSYRTNSNQAFLPRLLTFCAIIVIATVFLPLRTFGQDRVTVYLDRSEYVGWQFSFYNNNPSHLAISHIGLKMRTVKDTFQFANVTGPAATDGWSGDIYHKGDSIRYDFSATYLTTGHRDSMFQFSLDPTWVDFGQPITIEWNAFTNNTQIVDSGSFTVLPTSFQSLSSLDSASVVSSTLASGDPAFNFTIYNRNSLNYAIDGLAIQLVNQNAIMRPDEIKAPPDWILDSVTSNFAYFHTSNGGIGGSLSGFITAMRASQTVTNYNFVIWNLNGGVLIDRDTLLNVTATPGAGSAATTNDTVIATNTISCGYNFNVKNYHIANLTPPSAITKIRFFSGTSGVNFENSTTAPTNWAATVSANTDTLTYLSASYADGLQSGITSSNFAANIHNPTPNGAFTLHWQTFSGTTALDTGSLYLQCTEAAKTPDVATLNGGTNCNFNLSLTNQHTPTSNINAITLQIPAGKGSFIANTFTSSSSWSYNSTNAQSVRFNAVSGQTEPMAPNDNQILGFAIASGNSVPIIWQTYDANNAVISSDTVTANCQTITSQCDSVFFQTTDKNSCSNSMTIINRRGTGKAVNSIVITPQDGWKVMSASGPLPWISHVDPSGSSDTLTSSSGIDDGVTQAGFTVNFSGVGVNNNFGVEVQTTDEDQKVCTFDTTLICTPTSGVAESVSVQFIDMSVAPNPFYGRTDVTFSLPDREHVNLVLIDVLGRVVETVNDSWQDSGDHQITFDGSALPAGTYYLRMETPNARVTKKLIRN